VDLLSLSSADAEVGILGELPQRPRYIMLPRNIFIKNAHKMEGLGMLPSQAYSINKIRRHRLPSHNSFGEMLTTN